MKKIALITMVAMLGLATAFAQSPNYQGIIYVTPTGAGTQSGDSWANATSSIATAQNLAQEHNAMVWVAAGTYYGSTTYSGSNAFYLKEGVNVYGGFAGDEPDNFDLNLRDFVTNTSILDGNFERRVLFQSSDYSTPTTWDGFTIQNGRLSSNSSPYSDREKGGGVYLRLNGILKNCIVINNNSSWCTDNKAGGVFADHATILNCHISNNTSHNGGGIYALYATINDCQIYDNVGAYYGGGIYADNSTVTNCQIYNNSCTNHGGGVAARNNSTISECQIHHNTGSRTGNIGHGGGVYADNNSLITSCNISHNTNNSQWIHGGCGGGAYITDNSIITKCIISYNIAPSSGGGGCCLYESEGKYCIIFGNSSLSSGGGLDAYWYSSVSNCLIYNNSVSGNYGGGGVFLGSTEVCTNSTIVNNSAQVGGGGISSYGHGIVINCIVSGNKSNGVIDNIGVMNNNQPPTCSYSAVEGGYEGEHNIDISGQQIFVNPSLFAGSEDTISIVDWHLLPGTPCINAGDNSVVSDSIDLDGNIRIFQDTVDLGCYEWSGSNTGIHENHDLTSSMTVYPNPTTDIVNVQCTMNNVQEGTIEFHVYDAYGKLIRKVDVQTAQIDLSHYASGVYFVKAVADGNVVAVRKVVKQ